MTPTDPTRPIANSYWVESGRLLAGEYPGASNDEDARQRISTFLQAGFDTFIDLTQDGELESYKPFLEQMRSGSHRHGIQHQRFPIGDFGLPTRKQMTAILDALDAALTSGRKVYLHCWGGIGRTGTTVGCYLVRRGMSGEQALAQLAEWWQEVPKSSIHPRSPETALQAQFVRDWRG